MGHWEALWRPPSVLWSPEVPPQGGDCPASLLPCSPTWPHSPNLLLLFQRLSYLCQTKQSCLGVRLGASDGFTFSPGTLIAPRIGRTCVGSGRASAVDGAPCRGPVTSLGGRTGSVCRTTFSGKTTTLTGGHSTPFTERTAGAGVPPASLSRKGGVPRNFVPFRHGPQTWPPCLWTDTVECVVGVSSSWLLQALGFIGAGGGQTARSAPGGFEAEDPSSGSSGLPTLTSPPVQALVPLTQRGPLEGLSCC